MRSSLVWSAFHIALLAADMLAADMRYQLLAAGMRYELLAVLAAGMRYELACVTGSSYQLLAARNACQLAASSS